MNAALGMTTQSIGFSTATKRGLFSQTQCKSKNDDFQLTIADTADKEQKHGHPWLRMSAYVSKIITSLFARKFLKAPPFVPALA